MKITTIRLSDETWKKLRRLQEEEKVESIQDSVTRGLALLIESIEKPKSKSEEDEMLMKVMRDRKIRK